MTDPNPYAAPEPTPEESSERSTPEPQTLRAAVWQGVRSGFKVGSVIAIGWIGLMLVVFVIATLGGMTTDSDASWSSAIFSVVGMYLFCSVLGVIASVPISSSVYLLRKGIAAMRQSRADNGE